MQRDLLLLREMIDAAEQARDLVVGRTVAEVDHDRCAPPHTPHGVGTHVLRCVRPTAGVCGAS